MERGLESYLASHTLAETVRMLLAEGGATVPPPPAPPRSTTTPGRD